MGKRMITYLLVLGAVGYLFLMYIYPALSGLLIFVLLYPAAGIVYLIFAGRGLSVRVKQLSDYGEKEQQMKVSIQVCRKALFGSESAGFCWKWNMQYPASDKRTVYGFLKSRQTIHLNQTGAESGS